MGEYLSTIWQDNEAIVLILIVEFDFAYNSLLKLFNLLSNNLRERSRSVARILRTKALIESVVRRWERLNHLLRNKIRTLSLCHWHCLMLRRHELLLRYRLKSLSFNVRKLISWKARLRESHRSGKLARIRHRHLMLWGMATWTRVLRLLYYLNT